MIRFDTILQTCTCPDLSTTKQWHINGTRNVWRQSYSLDRFDKQAVMVAFKCWRSVQAPTFCADGTLIKLLPVGKWWVFLSVVNGSLNFIQTHNAPGDDVCLSQNTALLAKCGLKTSHLELMWRQQIGKSFFKDWMQTTFPCCFSLSVVDPKASTWHNALDQA